MKVLSTRRITNDRQHNAFTGACWFKGDLFVGYRQADIHHHDKGSRIIVQRSRDAGVTWDTVAVLRGHGDTRDAHLYTDGCRLYCTCYVERVANSVGFSGCAVTEDGESRSVHTVVVADLFEQHLFGKGLVVIPGAVKAL